MDERAKGFREDLSMLLRTYPFLLPFSNDSPHPYFTRLSKEVLNGKKLDVNYQKKLKNFTVKGIHNIFLALVNIDLNHLDSSVSRSLDLTIDTINRIEVDSPVDYYFDHAMQLPSEQLGTLSKSNVYHFDDLIDNMARGGRDGTSLSILNEAYNSSFENSYKPAYEGIKRVISSDNLKKEAHKIAESILCLDRTLVYEKVFKSDFRHIRNLLEHPADIRRDDHYQVQFDDDTILNIGVDELINMTMIVGLKSPNLSYFCNLLMMMKMYDLSSSLKIDVKG